MSKAKKTEKVYSFLWDRHENSPPARWHFNAMQGVISEPIVRGNIGLEVGCGCGYDTYIMAKANPSTHFVSLDISDGVYKARELTSGLNNVEVIQCSVLDMPFKEGMFDFAYSFGVLHHTEDPKKGFMEIVRVLKRNAPAFFYLYDDHSENPVKRIALKMIALIRRLTVKVPSRLLYAISTIASPFTFIAFTLPAKIMNRFRFTKSIAENMPFNFGTSPFSLIGDLYDRFSAPIEHRFSRQGLTDILGKCGFCDIHITRLRNTAGWVSWGYKS